MTLLQGRLVEETRAERDGETFSPIVRERIGIGRAGITLADRFREDPKPRRRGFPNGDSLRMRRDDAA